MTAPHNNNVDKTFKPSYANHRFDQVFELYALLDKIRKSYTEDSFYHSVTIEDFYGLYILSFREVMNNPYLTTNDVRSFIRDALKDRSDDCIRNNICNDRFHYKSHDVIAFTERHAYA